MDTAMIEVDAYPDTKFKGVVSEIPVSANTGVTTDQVTNFMVKILFLPESYEDKISETNPYPLDPECRLQQISRRTRRANLFGSHPGSHHPDGYRRNAERPGKKQQRIDAISSDGSVSSTTQSSRIQAHQRRTHGSGFHRFRRKSLAERGENRHPGQQLY